MSSRPGYKHTPLGWLPQDWEIAEIKSLATLMTNGFVGKATESYTIKADGVLYIQGYNVEENGFNFNGIKYIDKKFHERNKKSELQEGDLLTIQTGNVGLTGIVSKDEEGANCHALIITRLKPDVADPRFYHQYLNSELGRRRLKVIETGSTMKHINVGDLVRWLVPTPPKAEQEKIADILTTWDAAISKHKQVIGQIQQRNKGLMQRLLTGEKRLSGFAGLWSKEHIHKIAKEVSLKNRSFKELTVLSCTKYDGLVPSLEYFGRRVFGSDTSTYKVVPRNHFAYATNHIEEGSIGYQRSFDEALISPMYTVFKTCDNVYDQYLFRLLKSHYYIHEYCRRMEGSIDRRGGLRWNEFSKIIVNLPPYDEQVAIAQVLDKAEEAVRFLQQKLLTLQRQKKGLMQTLLTGELRIKTS